MVGLKVILYGWIGFTAMALGQTPLQKALTAGSPTASPATNVAVVGSGNSTEAIETRLAEARANLAAFADAAVTNAPAGVAPQDFWMRRALLHRLVRLYEQQLSNAAGLEAIHSRKAELVREAQSWTRYSEPPPYSILLTDRLREEIQAEQQKILKGDSAARMLEQLMEENRALLKQADEKLRQFNEQLETATAPAVVARLSWQRELERLRSQMTAASVGVLHSEELIRQETVAESRVRLGLLQRQLLFAEAGAKFTQTDLEQVLGQVDRQREQMEAELAEARTRRVDAFQALNVARAESRQAAGAPGSPEALLATERVSAREAQLDATDKAIYVLRLMLEGANIERTAWELRFAAYDSLNAETLRESERRLSVFTRRLDIWHEYARQQLDVSSSQLQLQETRVNNLSTDSGLLPLARERLAALRDIDQSLLRFNRGIDRVERLAQRWAEGLRTAEGNLPLTGKVRNVFSDASSFLNRLWTFELFTAEDTITVDGQKITGKRSVTVGKVVMAIFILVAGIWITGLISRIVEPLIVKRLKIEPNQAVLIRRWLRAAMIVGLLLFSLVSVKIPLTVFAFAGGALAIGLGFGTQTMLKNLVSGLILLFERPFRVGDVLDVGGHKGTVTSIGLRASVLQLWDGTETLIPNSSLLENNVTNWTYSNRNVRFIVAVGVAYGTDPRRVTQILNDVAERHGLVEKEPKPLVLFTAFADSTLNFELRFWVNVSKANSAQVSSDLRLMIAGAFAENGITIDFPQRDIHLHAAHPLQVQVVPADYAPTEQATVKTAADPKPNMP